MKIIKTEQRQSFCEELEKRAKQLLSNQSAVKDFTTSIIEREVALTLDHIERNRNIHNDINTGLLLTRFYVYNELVQQKKETHYRPYRPNSIENLKARLTDIDKEQRAHGLRHAETLGKLHDRLLYHLQRHMQLTQTNGHRNHSQ